MLTSSYGIFLTAIYFVLNAFFFGVIVFNFGTFGLSGIFFQLLACIIIRVQGDYKQPYSR